MSLIIEIEDPQVDSYSKFNKALSILSKATRVDLSLDNHTKSEPTPYTALRELADGISKDVEDRMFVVWTHIVKNWLGVELNKATGDDIPFKLNGKIFINPKSGKRMTMGQWKSLQKELTKLFTWMYGDTQERLVLQAVATGKLIQQMDPDKRITAPKTIVKPASAQAVSADAQYQNILTWADVHTGELITDVTARSRKKISDTIIQAFQDGKSQKQLRDQLFENFGDMNRDWRRIAETETATNFNNGYLVTELKAKPDDEHIFMIGISGAGACAHCASHVADHVVVLLEDSPGGDTKSIDGKSYTAIWPGKSNVGRKHADWWVAAGAQHPHCRCTWTRYYPAMEKYMSKLKGATSS